MREINSLADLLAMLSGEPLEPAPLAGKPEDVTSSDMVRGDKFLNDLLSCKTVEEFRNVMEWIDHWHKEPGLKDNDFRHAYLHALMELPPLLAIVKLGPIALAQMDAERYNKH